MQKGHNIFHADYNICIFSQKMPYVISYSEQQKFGQGCRAVLLVIMADLYLSLLTFIKFLHVSQFMPV